MKGKLEIFFPQRPLHVVEYTFRSGKEGKGGLSGFRMKLAGSCAGFDACVEVGHDLFSESLTVGEDS